jgi:hypothetical protein
MGIAGAKAGDAFFCCEQRVDFLRKLANFSISFFMPCPVMRRVNLASSAVA